MKIIDNRDKSPEGRRDRVKNNFGFLGIFVVVLGLSAFAFHWALAVFLIAIGIYMVVNVNDI